MPLKLRKVRRSRKISQPMLAKRAGVSRSYISELETGKYDPTKIICKLCKALNCTPNDLIDWEDETNDKG